MLIVWEERQPHEVTRPEGKFLPLKGSQDRWGPIMSISRALFAPGVSNTQTKASRPSWDTPPYGKQKLS